MVSPLISIVIPVYNVERYIERCVDSVLCQTYKNIEILLINDGSTDNSGFLCEKLANKDSRIKVFHKINEGLSATRNFGVEQSNGQFVGFVDSDDYIEEDMYEKLFNAIQSSQADMAECSLTRIYKNYSETFYNGDNFQIDLDAEGYVREYIDNVRLYGSAWCKLLKKEIAEKVKFPVGKIYEDCFYSLDLVKYLKKVTVISDSLYNYYIREGSITTKSFSHSDMDYIECINSWEDYIDNYFPQFKQLMLKRKVIAYLSIFNQTLELRQRKNNEDYKYLKYYFKSSLVKILQSKVPLEIKIAVLLLNINESFYKIILNILKNKYVND